ncbi:MAG: S9 family peptidase [Bryobacterales bacterium]|nr:S9 family peptidase [Bryobacterales bacterium]
MKIALSIAWLAVAVAAAAPRPMTFLDVLELRSVQGGGLSQDGQSFVYAIDELDWKEGKRFTDLYVAETGGGPARRMTFTKGKNERDPRFAMDGRSFAFLSDREGPNQLYLMSAGGGEAQRVSADLKGGARSAVRSYAFSRDGRWLAYLAGTPESAQIYLRDLAAGAVRALTSHETGIDAFAWAPDSSKLYFTAPDTLPATARKRIELKFDVRHTDAPQPQVHLWQTPLEGGAPNQITSGEAYSVQSFQVSRDGAWITFLGRSTSRYAQGPDGVYEQEAYLVEASTGRVERLTDNRTSESLPAVSPDGRWVALTAAEDFQPFRRARAWVRATSGGEWKMLPGGWDYDVGDLAWSKDSRSLHFVAGVGLNRNLYAIDWPSGEVRSLTSHTGVVAASYHHETGAYLLAAEAPDKPREYFLARAADLGAPARWNRLSAANPQMDEFALGAYEAFQWKASDGERVEGVLVKPAGYEPGKRYPLIVQIHGGPAGAYVNGFPATYSTYVHVFAGNGYLVFQPNYRGSTNYGERFRMQIAGDYFRQGFDDIMTGVDELVRRGLADPDKLGMMGWSAGGHWSNWTLTHTDRFKAISSGAGAVNWISMYGQTDMQSTREFYFKGKPWENWDHYVEVSPLKYIRNAKTPTLIHVGADDLRVPRPQSEELYMALKKLGVPTEFLVYPDMGHGITEPRYQYVKMASEFGWFEKWLRGKETWLDWDAILATVPQ